MNTKFGIRNFRVFGDNGISFDLKPITILTGENSSGKSSLVKAMLLLRNYFRAVKNEPTQNPAAVQLDFTDPALKMSGFDSAISKVSSHADEISFSYVTGSDFAPYPFTVEYSFVRDEENQTKGELRDIKITYNDKVMILLENRSGRLLIKQADVQTWFKALKIYLKGIEYSKSMKYSNSLDLENVYEAKSKNGIVITNWKDYDYPCFSSIEVKKKEKVRPEKKEDPELVAAIQKSEETGLLFYFPVLEELKGLSKEETLDILRDYNVQSLEPRWHSLVRVFDDCKPHVLNAFESSSLDKFVDFLKEIEAQVFSSIVNTKAPEGVLGVSSYLEALFGQDIFADTTYMTWDFDRKISSIPEKIYAFLHIMHFAKSSKSDDFISRKISPMDFASDGTPCDYVLSCQHFLKNSLLNFLPLCISELICPCIFDSLTFVGSSFTPVQRLHSFEEDSNLVSLLKEYKKCIRIVNQNKRPDKKSVFVNFGTVDYQIGAFINKWLKKLNIAQELVIKEDSEGLGFRLFLRKEKETLTSLADEGRGITQIILILLQIEVAIMQKKISTTGFGNVYTVCVDYPTLAIEEPEVSLHPCWQSMITEILVDANNEGIHFIVETHSEYLIRKTQAIIANYKTKKEFDEKPFVVYYIERSGVSYDLEYTESGRFAKSFGPGFFDEASRSSVEILKRERRMKDEA